MIRLMFWVVLGLQNPPVPKIPALIQAAQQGDIDIVRALLKSGADLLVRAEHGGTALHAAAASQQEPTFIELVDFVLAPLRDLVPAIAKDSHYTDSQPMPSAAGPVAGQPSRQTIGCVEQLRLF